MAMTSEDLKRYLDPKRIGSSPIIVRLSVLIIILAAIVFAGYWFDWQNQLEQINGEKAKEEQLRTTFLDKKKQAIDLPAYRKQLEDMKEMLRTMLRQLPSKTEMPDLLVDISQTALAAGIVVDLFQPGGEVVKEFYAEKPIQLKMMGSYHQFGTFISGVASLPRVVILTMHDVSLRPVKSGPNAAPAAGGQLSLEGTVKTYRYVDDEEAAAAQAAAKPKKGAPPKKTPPAAKPKQGGE